MQAHLRDDARGAAVVASPPERDERLRVAVHQEVLTNYLVMINYLKRRDD